MSLSVDPNRHSGEPAYYVKALSMALPAIMLGLQISGWIFFLPGALQGHCDFRHLYTAGYMVRTGHRSQLYDYASQQTFQNSLVSTEPIALPFNHLAYESLLFVPYSLLPYRSAYFLFLATNLVLLAVAMRLMAPWTKNLGRLIVWLPGALFLTFLPVPAAFMQGQDSIILLLLFCCALLSVSRGNKLLAGFLVGLCLFKFQIVIPVAVLFLLWRRWRFVIGFAVSAFAIMLVSLLLVGFAPLSTYAHSLSSMSVRETALDQVRFAIYPIGMPNLRGLLYFALASHVSAFWTQLLTVVSSLGVLIWAGVKGTHRGDIGQLALALTVAAFLSYHLFIHDLSILLIPIAVLIGETAFTEQDFSMRTISALTMFCAPAVVALTNIHPFVIGLPLVWFLAVQLSPESSGTHHSVGAAVNKSIHF